MSLYTLVIIRAEDRGRANVDALQWDPVGGDRSFTAGLSPTGIEPPTHYWANPVTADATHDAIAAFAAASYPNCRVVRWNDETEPGRPDAVLAELGLQRIRGVL